MAVTLAPRRVAVLGLSPAATLVVPASEAVGSPVPGSVLAGVVGGLALVLLEIVVSLQEGSRPYDLSLRGYLAMVVLRLPVSGMCGTAVYGGLGSAVARMQSGDAPGVSLGAAAFAGLLGTMWLTSLVRRYMTGSWQHQTPPEALAGGRSMAQWGQRGRGERAAAADASAHASWNPPARPRSPGDSENHELGTAPPGWRRLLPGHRRAVADAGRHGRLGGRGERTTAQ
jgi:hypothetical protein